MFQINSNGRQPIYEQLMREILRLKALGVLLPDTQLPSVRSLAAELGINPNTVQKAYQMLEAKGILYSISGKGSFVSGSKEAGEKLLEEATDAFYKAIAEAASAGISEEDAAALVTKVYQERRST